VNQQVITQCKPDTRICLRTAENACINASVSCRITAGKFFKAPSGDLFHGKIEDFSYLRMEAWAASGNPANWFDGDFQYGEIILPVLYLIAIAIVLRIAWKIYRKFRDSGRTQKNDGKNWPSLGKQMKRKESEGLEVFKGMKDVGYSKSLEDLLNDGSRSEDWNKPRMHYSSDIVEANTGVNS
jgi:hypothetical protein